MRMRYNLTADQINDLKGKLIQMNHMGYMLNPDQVNFLIDTCTLEELASAIVVYR